MNTNSERTGAVSVMMPLSNSKSGFYIMKEIWKDISGYEGSYQISSFGKVKSLPRRSTYGRILILGISNWGYNNIPLIKNGQQKSHKVHRLVALHFIPNPENKPEVNHLNGIKTDNRISNLEWVTHQENIIHSFKNGFHGSQKGSLNHNAKLNEAQVREIRQLYATKNYSQKQMASKYNLSVAHLGKIVNYKRWNN